MKKFILLFFMFMTIGVLAITINIPEDYATIQEGINASEDGDEIIVAPGTYVENINFNGKAVILGSLFYTTQDTSYISQTIIDGNQDGVVVGFYSGEDSTSVLTGFTITNGNFNDGGGIYCDDSSPSLENVSITGNSANERGGGIYCYYSSPNLDNVTIIGNSAEVYGGGIYCNNSSPSLENVTITDNVVYSPFGSGGGIYCYESSPSLENVTITNNSTEGNGGGIYFTGSNPVFSSENRCNIYLNNTNNRGNGNDIYCFYNSINVIVDTFTVLNPKDFYAAPIENFTFDILHGLQDQINADLYVSPDGNNTNTGLTIDDPLQTIQYACSVVLADSQNPHIIHLAEGIYSPSTNSEFFPVDIPNFVSLCGVSETGVILDAEEVTRVIRLYNTENVTISDLTIKNGYASSGGGIYCYSSNLDLQNVTITDNSAEGNGGGILFSSSSPSLENVTITDNSTEGNGGGIFCSGNSNIVFSSENRCNIYLNNTNNRGNGNDIYCLYNNINVIVDTFTVLNPTDFHASPIENFTFDILHGLQDQINADLYVSPDGNNTNTGLTIDDPLQTIQYACSVILADSQNPHTIHLAEGTYSSSINGEFFPVNIPDYVSLTGDDEDTVILDAEGTAEVIRLNHDENVTISDLTITNGHASSGGGIFCNFSSPDLENVTITDNSAEGYGGGIYCFLSSPSLANVTISDNSAEHHGGGIYCPSSSPSLVNVTITDNSADESGGGIYCSQGSNPILVNCISWNNSPQEVEFCDDYDLNIITLAYSNIAGGEEGIVTNNNGIVNWLEGNIDTDPLFVDAELGDYHLTEDSPCIDAGTSFFEYEGEVLVDLSEDEYYGIAPDMGAHEYGLVSTDEFIIQNSKLKIQNYPNPFNPETNILFELSSGSNVLIEIYNIKGQKVTTLVNSPFETGTHKVTWNAAYQSSGVYLLRCITADKSETKKLILLK